MESGGQVGPPPYAGDGSEEGSGPTGSTASGLLGHPGPGAPRRRGTPPRRGKLQPNESELSRDLTFYSAHHISGSLACYNMPR